MFIAASSAIKYLNTYDTDMTLMLVSSSQNLQVHSFRSCRITDSVVFGFSKTGEIKLPHFVHTRHYMVNMEMFIHETTMKNTYV